MNFEVANNYKDFKEKDFEILEESTKEQLDKLNLEIVQQKKGKAEELPKEEIDNIVNFYKKNSDKIESFVVRASADGFGFSKEGAESKKLEAKEMSEKLKSKGINVQPDLSSGNSAQAWLRAMTLIDQLPEDVLNGIKDKIDFKVEQVKEKDEKGTYRYGAIDIKIDGKIIKNVEKITDSTATNMSNIDYISDIPNVPYISKNIDFDVTELSKFESWEELKKPLSIPILFKLNIPVDGKKSETKYFFKSNVYKLKGGKIVLESSEWRGTNKENFEHTLKNNSRAIDITDTLDNQYKDKMRNMNTLDRFSFLNSIIDQNPKFALNQYYKNYHQKKRGEVYLAKAKEMEVKEKLNYLASN